MIPWQCGPAKVMVCSVKMTEYKWGFSVGDEGLGENTYQKMLDSRGEIGASWVRGGASSTAEGRDKEGPGMRGTVVRQGEGQWGPGEGGPPGVGGGGGRTKEDLARDSLELCRHHLYGDYYIS